MNETLKTGKIRLLPFRFLAAEGVMMQLARFYTLAFGIVVLVGCGRSGPPPARPGVEVSGTIQAPSGAKLQGGILVLRPVGGIHGASAPIQPDGSFVLADPNGKKAVVPGKYRVYVRVDEAIVALARSIPAKYQSTEDDASDVEVDIEEPTADLKIRLKS